MKRNQPAALLVWAALAAFAVSFAYASAGISWFILRRDVDRTDITEVSEVDVDEDAPAEVVSS